MFKILLLLFILSNVTFSKMEKQFGYKNKREINETVTKRISYDSSIQGSIIYTFLDKETKDNQKKIIKKFNQMSEKEKNENKKIIRYIKDPINHTFELALMKEEPNAEFIYVDKNKIIVRDNKIINII